MKCYLCDAPAVAVAGACLRGQRRGPFTHRVTGPWWKDLASLCGACLAFQQRRWPRGTRWRVRVQRWLTTEVCGG